MVVVEEEQFGLEETAEDGVARETRLGLGVDRVVVLLF